MSRSDRTYQEECLAAVGVVAEGRRYAGLIKATADQMAAGAKVLQAASTELENALSYGKPSDRIEVLVEAVKVAASAII